MTALDEPALRSGTPVPPVGVGFKPSHADAIAADRGFAGFFEVHAENYMGAGGMPHRLLETVRRDHALALHGVALSIGGSEPLCRAHLARFASLVRRYEPFLVSEHLAWSTHAGCYYNDLLPLPYTRATLAGVCNHVDEVQAAIGRRLLLENPATYLVFEESTLAEPDFLAEVAQRTGCGLLLDLNNLYVSAVNHGRSPTAALDAFPIGHVGQIHLAGHAEQADGDGRQLLIDSHDGIVAEPVWSLFEHALRLGVHAPTLVEWDSRLPPWAELRAQADSAHQRMHGSVSVEAAHA
ncbi:DUF692 domain-containing protein [Piscinibacter koreensis]|uniref:DUF692 domain-containing protein n=1 Tax=Piscinibacter koreensis TaxID=2742824 RepID=A0A7Y6NP59_9BURK|nr:DUF692 domain-containing protein [Schlegelella koreensis]NUZ06788.1 DUF692 domain-containing protein [Schlegelella koreensis]